MGAVSRWGIVAFALFAGSSGAKMTKTVRDAAIMLGAMAGGWTPKDKHLSAGWPCPFSPKAALTGTFGGKKIGIPPRIPLIDGIPAEIDKTVAGTVLPCLPRCRAKIFGYFLAAHTRKYACLPITVIAPAEALVELAR